MELKGDIANGFEAVGDAFLKNFSELNDLGASACLYIDQKKVVDIWGGCTDEKEAEPDTSKEWQHDTLVNIWSTTKGFVSLAMHMLMDRGQLDIDQPVAHYWPEFGANGKEEIPVRFLLNHRSGMAGWQNEFSKQTPPEILYDWDEATRLLAEQEPFWEPGTASGYHLLSYGHLVGEVLKRIDGRPIDKFIKEEVTTPLGLDFHMPVAESDLSRISDVRLMPNFKTMSSESRAKLSKLAQFAFTNPLARVGDANSEAWRKAVIPAANGHATAEAVAKLYGVLSTGGAQLISEESIERMREPAESGVDLILGAGMSEAELIWGLGYRINHDNSYGPNERAFYHGGFGGSLGFCDPEHNFGFGYVMNRMDMSSRSGQRAAALLDAVYSCL